MQRTGKRKDIADFDGRFVWNEYIVRSLLDFRDRIDATEREELDQCQFIVRETFSPERFGLIICFRY